MNAVNRNTNESGVALVTALLALLIISGLMAGMFAAVNADARSSAIDRDQTQAYAAAHAGLEKLTSDLAALFAQDASPSTKQITDLEKFPPSIENFKFTAPGGSAGSGYDISFKADAKGNPVVDPDSDITAGPYQGFKGFITKYFITITALSKGGAEVRLKRELQTVAVPVFQFGVFSETDLTFYAGDNFDFGGRVHTNGSLFLSQVAGRTLKFTDRMTAVNQVVRTRFSNGLPIASWGFTGSVLVPTTVGNPGAYRALKYTSPNEGSVAAMPDSAPNIKWEDISKGTYKGNIRTGLTGAKKLDLPIVEFGAQPIDLIRRPATDDEDTANAPVFGQRYFGSPVPNSNATSLRILLSDDDDDITNLPTIVTATPPVDLSTLPGIARAVGPLAAAATVTAVSGTSPNLKISVAALPIEFDLAPVDILVDTSGTGTTWHTMKCTGRKAHNTFGGCAPTLPLLIPAGRQVKATIDGITVTTTTAGSNPLGGNTLTVVNYGTFGFKPIFFWTHKTPASASTHVAPTLVTCTGYNDTKNQFDPCSWYGSGLGTNGTAPTATTAPAAGDIISTHSLANKNEPLVNGFIKIEKQNAAGVWSDVTAEILALGIGDTNQAGTWCGDPTPNAILRIQRLRDNGGINLGTSGAPDCGYKNSPDARDWWPNALLDTRESNFRDEMDSVTGHVHMGGVMQYIALDVNNLRRWLAGAIGTTGTQTYNNNGYIVYFSDRRGDHNEDDATTPNRETGEYGAEDVVNPAEADGEPVAGSQELNDGEDFNANEELDLYGQTPSTVAGVIPAGAVFPFNADGRPNSTVNGAQGRVNRVVLFRRALKLVNGGICVTGQPNCTVGVSNLPASGLTIASENPVYIQGNYNSNSTDPKASPGVPAAILADAVTLLSNNWAPSFSTANGEARGGDARSFTFANNHNKRPSTTTGYRVAVIAGKGLSFDNASVNGNKHFLFGTDGGVGNFLRLLEDWETPAASINYRGSIVSLFTSRQAIGTFKYGPNVYDYADRNFFFDDNFLKPELLPPGTPMFRDVNTLTFRQILRPTQ